MRELQMEQTLKGKTTARIKGYVVVLSVIIATALIAYLFLRSIYAVPILMYHNIDQHYKESKLSVSPESFERQMRFLRKHGYNIVSLEELVELLSSEKPLPYKTIAVTFDDGYKNNYTAAFCVLKKYNIPASVFVVADKVGKAGYLSWEELKEMSDSGIDIGSHTLSEPYLPEIEDKSRLKKEIFESRHRLKSRIPQAGGFFAYPGGGFDKEIRRMVIEAGYKGACATNPGRKYPSHDRYGLKRMRISRTSDNLFVFWIESSGFYTWIKEHRDEK